MVNLSNEASMLAVEFGQNLAPSGDFSGLTVIRRSGDVVQFNPTKITVAITKAYIAVHGQHTLASNSVREQIKQLTELVVKALCDRRPNGGSVHIEDIQDQVELGLMRNGEYEVARSYVLYREERNRERIYQCVDKSKHDINVVYKNGERKLLDIDFLFEIINSCAEGLTLVDVKVVLDEALRNLYDGVSEGELFKSIILASRQLIEFEPEYNFLTARLLSYTIAREACKLLASLFKSKSASLGSNNSDSIPILIYLGKYSRYALSRSFINTG